MAGWNVRTWPPTSGGTSVRSVTDAASMPSAARCSRVPSVATISTPSVWSSRANALRPSRLATESSARTCAVPPRAVRPGSDRWHDRMRSPRPVQLAGATSARVYRGLVAYSDGPSTPPARPAHRRRARAPPALVVPVPGVQQRELPGPVQRDPGGGRRPADRDGRLLQRPHAPAAPAPGLRADVRVDPVDGGDHVQPADRVLGLQVRLDHRAVHDRDRLRRPAVDPLRALPAVLRGVRAPAGQAALLLAPAVHAPRGHHPDEVRAAASPPLSVDRCPSRSAASGSAIGGPRVHPARRGSRARSSRRARRA